MSISTTINILETAGISRHNEPVGIGMPLPKGTVRDCSGLVVSNSAGMEKAVQFKPLNYWSDGSLKWVLLDFIVDMPANSSEQYLLTSESVVAPSAVPGPSHSVRQSESGIVIQSEEGQYKYNTAGSGLFSIALAGENKVESQLQCALNLTTSQNKTVSLELSGLSIEEAGPVRTRLLLTGCYCLSPKKILRAVVRIDHFAGSGLCKAEIEIHNPSAALHPGGIWDLGDPGSVVFKDLSLVIKGIDAAAGIEWASVAGENIQQSANRSWLLYQDSSGGPQWDSPNHVDADGKLTVSFPGYRVSSGVNSADELLEKGDRATPFVRVKAGNRWVAAGVENFWQNFPKVLEASDDQLRIALFPQQSKSGFELQGGERKRHIVWFELGDDEKNMALPGLLNPLGVRLDPDWVEQTRAVPCFTAVRSDTDKSYLNYISNAVEGENSFFAKRETIDEYGWRHFGDLYADHEAAFHTGPELYPSHYNNQYDFVSGAFFQYLRSGDQRWRQLMSDLARHVADIDIYHTDEDRGAYNRGQFWHSYHYQPAGTGTHRGFTKVGIPQGQESFYGGGPSNEQDYSSGLLQYYFLTGDSWARDVVLGLASWVLGMDDGRQTLFGLIDDGPTGLASQTGSTDYHHPGRGAGNSINTLIDAFILTKNRRYFDKADELIRRCIHPKDNLDDLKLDEPEIRWFYLVFLQILGKYLDTKTEMGESDFMYFYARDSLLHYAKWVFDNEVPYKDVLHKVEYPTETWSAQDVRKACVMNLAAKYAPSAELRDNYRRKARFFYSRCINDLLTFKTAYLTRPLVLLTVYGAQQDYYDNFLDETICNQAHAHDFGEPNQFRNQRQRLKETLKSKLQVTMREGKRLVISKVIEKFPALKALYTSGNV